MALTTSALTLIGRRHPAIFDLLGNPYGPFTGSRGAEVFLNPQPLPPGPPDGMRTGFHAGAALVQLAFTAHHLHVGFDIDVDDWCPTPPRRPKLPPWPGPRPRPWRFEVVDESWGVDYVLGLAGSLEVSASVWEGFAGADVLGGVHGRALEIGAKQG